VTPLLASPAAQPELFTPAEEAHRAGDPQTGARQRRPSGLHGRPGAVRRIRGLVLLAGVRRVDDEVFRDLVIARAVEPTSLLDTARVLTDLGRTPASYATMKRTLTRAVATSDTGSAAGEVAGSVGSAGSYRDRIAALCFSHALTSGDISLVLYDTTTLYFEAENEDDLRKVGYSKERRVDPQIVVGLLVDRQGFPLEVGCFEGNRAETTTIVPVVKAFADRHQVAKMVVVADAGMLSAKNLAELDQANLRFIVGSKVTKAPMDLASHFRWHGDAFTDGQVIDSLTPRIAPRAGARSENDPALRAEPVWDSSQHPDSWRAVWSYSARRAARDRRTLTAQENRARAVVAGEKTARTPRFHDLWHIEQSFRMSKTDLRARPMFHRTRDAIEAHLTIVFTALALTREAQNRTRLAIRNLVRQLRPLRSATIAINGAVQTIHAAIPDQQQALLDALKKPRTHALSD
jgi:hypothetical protein